MPTSAEKAAAIFDRSFNCSQSVFSAFSTRFGLSERTALKLASPFGGGIARQGEICGAVTGALMVLGLAHGAHIPAGKEAIYQLARECMQRFSAKHGSCLCRELIGCDISTPEGWQKARESGKMKAICPGLVRDAAEIVQALLEAGTLNSP
jgi:C_GCAxxG_C_C family probable redox protein